VNLLATMAGAVLFAGCTAVAQQPSGESGQKAATGESQSGPTFPEADKLTVHSNLVFLPTQVRRKNGETIYGLKPDQFVVEDNGVRQSVRIEEDPESTGLSLVVVVQCGRSAESELSKFKGLATMVEGIVGDAPHEVAVVSYGEGPYVLGDFTSDSETVRFALARLKPCGDFHAATIDAVYYAINMLKRRRTHYRRAILLIGESRDHGSRSKLHDVVAELGVSDTVIYSMTFAAVRDEIVETLRHPYGQHEKEVFTPWPPPSPQPTPSPQPSPAEARPAALPAEPAYLDHAPLFTLPVELVLAINALRRNSASELATLSGGEYMSFTSQKSFEDNLQRISNHIHNYYLLSFKPPGTPAFGLHSLRVRIPDYPDAVIQTRRNYWSGILEAPAVANPEQKP
jgi:VWFA-related protein